MSAYEGRRKKNKSRDHLVATSVTYACITLFKISAFQELAYVHWSSCTHKSVMKSIPIILLMNSSQMLRTITQRCQSTRSYSALNLPGSRRCMEVHCTKVHFSHKAQTLREAWKLVQEQAHGQLLHLMNFFFHISY